MKMLSVAVATLLLSSFLFASSYYPARIGDAKAIYLANKSFPVQGDGVADDSDAIHQAINIVQETTNQGILFVPAGRYRLTKTLYIWPRLPLTWFVTSRPVVVLAP